MVPVPESGCWRQVGQGMEETYIRLAHLYAYGSDVHDETLRIDDILTQTLQTFDLADVVVVLGSCGRGHSAFL